MTDRFSATAVDQSYVNSVVATQSSGLATKTYVDNQDATKAKKTAVDTADNGYLLASTKGAASGIASLGSDNFVPAAQVPAGAPGALPKYYVGSITFSSDYATSNTNAMSTRVGNLSIPAQDTAYQILVFAMMRGWSTAAQGSYGQITAVDETGGTNYVLAKALCTNTNVQNNYVAVPVTITSQTAWSYAATTATTVGLYAAMYSGSSTYNFTATEFFFYALVLPVL